MNNNTTVACSSGDSANARGANSWFSLSGPHMKAPVLILLVSLWICLVDNMTLWSELGDRLLPFDGRSVGFVFTLLSLMVLLLSVPLLLLGQRYVLKPLLVFMLLLSGVLAYFTQHLGVVYDIEMVRNVVETVRDKNTQESMELLSWALVRSLLLTAVIPIVFVLLSRVDYGSFWRDVTRRIVVGAGVAALALMLVMINFKYITYVSRENHDLEVYLTPFYPIKTTKQLVMRAHEARTFVFQELGDDAVRVADSQRTVGIMVVGETARRGNFSLNGYARDTNPELARRQIVNFSNTTSCGTSTAFSVPCMFSFLGEGAYTPEKAEQESNVLDVLQKAGVKAVWVDSNSSCKGVCKRIENVNLLANPDESDPLFVDGAWHDEILLEHVDHYLDSTSDDVILVLHTMGSHGPAYYRRFPEAFAHFKPYCQSKAPQECSSEEILNAYDNTVLYTDHVLATLIDRLDMRNDRSFLFYASDHGESLGENGIYLHGLPRFVAPAEQSEIPMLAWFSPELMSERGWNPAALGASQVATASNHDNISASLLGLYRVKTSLYQPSLDLFSDSAMIGRGEAAELEVSEAKVPTSVSVQVTLQ